mgnify:CR=1 FL=1
MSTGTVKFYNENKGFGFIAQDNGKNDLFFHITNLDTKTISDGAKVEFEIGEGQGGPQAMNIKEVYSY